MQRKSMSEDQCKRTLEMLDYLRKSYCTNTASQGLFSNNRRPLRCAKVLEKMETMSTECYQEVSNLAASK